MSVFLLVGCKKNEPVVLPIVNTGSYSINAGVVTCGGEVTNAGNGVISDRGICYMAGNSSPSISNSLIRAGNGTGDNTETAVVNWIGRGLLHTGRLVVSAGAGVVCSLGGPTIGKVAAYLVCKNTEPKDTVKGYRCCNCGKEFSA